MADDLADDPADEPQEWSAPVGAVGLGVVATIGLAAWAVAVADPPGRLLVGLAAVAALALTALGGLARPRLAAGPEGLSLRGLRGRTSWPWSRVDAVRVQRMRRLGMPASYVEVDTRDDDGTEHLHVLGRLELGTDPVDVAATLQQHRARAGRRAEVPGEVSGERRRSRHDEDDEHHGEGPDDPQPDGGT